MSEDIISRLLANDPTLTEVSIHPGSGPHQICSSVQDNSNIRSLRIGNLAIDTVAANDLSAALGRMPYLEEVTMMRCPWESVEVAITLASSLAGRNTLQKLEVSEYCNIDDGCVQAIATSFSAHQSLQTLLLQANPFGNVGAVSIGSLFALNESLKLVNLCWSNIDADGFEEIARGIAQNRTLEIVKLSENTAELPSVQNAFKRALYIDDSIETVLTGSNHTLQHILGPIGLSVVGDAGLGLLLAMNSNGPDEARRRKLIRFLDKNPGSLISMGVNDTLLPSAIEKIGRVGGLDAMYLSVRGMPDMFEKKGIL